MMNSDLTSSHAHHVIGQQAFFRGNEVQITHSFSEGFSIPQVAKYDIIIITK